MNTLSQIANVTLICGIVVLDVWRDVERDMVMVKGYERRCFGCSDPRAMLGAFPNRA